MFKRKNKKNRSSGISYVSNFSDRDFLKLGLRKKPGTVVENVESLWDCRIPVSLRMRKTKVADDIPKTQQQEIPKTQQQEIPKMQQQEIPKVNDVKPQSVVEKDTLDVIEKDTLDVIEKDALDVRNNDLRNKLQELKYIISDEKISKADKSQQTNLNMARTMMKSYVS